MLVVQGMDDPNANEPVVAASVKETCQRYPESQLEYMTWVRPNDFVVVQLLALMLPSKTSRMSLFCMLRSMYSLTGSTIDFQVKQHTKDARRRR
jgi:hypothetical protein